MTSFILDPVTGDPGWKKVVGDASPKAAFALEAAKRIRRGRLTIAGLEQLIIRAANAQLADRGTFKSVETLKQVQTEVSGTAYMWFQEIKRVCTSEAALDRLIAQGGAGLTALYREIGPSQHQRAKGFSDPVPSAALKPLKALIKEVEISFDQIHDRSSVTEILQCVSRAKSSLERAVAIVIDSRK